MPEVAFARREGSAFGVEALSLDTLRSRSLDHSIHRPHRVDFEALIVATSEGGSHMVDFVHHALAPGTVVHVTPGQVQSFVAEPAADGFLMLFQPEVAGVEAPPLRWPASFALDADDRAVLEELLALMASLKARRLSVAPDRVAWRLLSAVLELCEGAASRHLEEARVPRSVEFEAFDTLLEANFARRRELSWYARELGYAERTVTRWCRRVVGCGAKAHIDRRVALEAKRLLVHSDLTVESIAARLGFSEATNFVKFFGRLEKTTPGGFRRSYA